MDSSDTARRELEEELGVPQSSVRLMDLTPDRWLEMFSTLGRHGVLTRYSAKFYLALLDHRPRLRGRHRWFDEKEVKERRGAHGERFLLHPAYFEYLLNESGGIEALPVSLRDRIAPPRLSPTLDFVREHRAAIVAVLAVLGAVVGFLKALLW